MNTNDDRNVSQGRAGDFVTKEVIKLLFRVYARDVIR